MKKSDIKNAFKQFPKPIFNTVDDIKNQGYEFESVDYVIPNIEKLAKKMNDTIEGVILDIDASLESGWVTVKLREEYQGYNYVFISIDDIEERIVNFIQDKLNVDFDEKIDEYVRYQCEDKIVNWFL